MLEHAEADSKTFVEVGSPFDQFNEPTTMPLSGAVVAVSDCLDVEGFSTRYNLTSTMMHDMPSTSHPFVHWLCQQGARVSGKLRGHSPLGLDEATVIGPHHQGASALRNRCCDYVVCTAFMGVAGATACVSDDVCCFTPSGNTFDIEDTRYGSSCGSIAILAHSVDDLVYLWQAYTGTLRTIERIVSEGKRREGEAVDGGDGVSVLGGMWAQLKSGGRLLSSTAIAIKKRLQGAPSTGPPPFQSPSMARSNSASKYLSSWNVHRDGVLKVGYPASWIDSHSEGTMTSVDFEVRLKALYEQRAFLGRRNRRKGGRQPAEDGSIYRGDKEYRIEFVPVHLDIDLHRIVPHVVKTSSYELARQLTENERKWRPPQSTSKKRRDASALAAATPPSPDVSTPAADEDRKKMDARPTGLLEELPQSIVTANFEGSKISAESYHHDTSLWNERISSIIDDAFVDVDILCCPILSHPYREGNIRSVSYALPFILHGNPTLSLRLDADTSVMLVGETGQGSQLLEDAVSFASFLKGDEAGRWWWTRGIWNR